MSQEFKEVLVSGQDRSKMDLSMKAIGTLDFGRLQPIMCQEVLPNDDISVNVGAFTRAAPLAAPVMGKMRQDIDFFFVPYRILYKNWYKYNQGIMNDTPPYVQSLELTNLLLQRSDIKSKDRRAIISGLGYPLDTKVKSGSIQRVNILPFRAYQRIWFDWYRDPQLISDSEESVLCPDSSGLSSSQYLFEPRYRCFKKDYLTALQHSPNANGLDLPQTGNSYSVDRLGMMVKDLAHTGSGQNSLYYASADVVSNPGNVRYNPNETGLTDVATANSYASIQYLRAANALQRWFELNNIVGTRTIDRLRARYGIAPTDVRLDRAEFLGRTTTNFNIGDVVATSQNSSKATNSPFGTASNYLNEGTMQGQSTGKAVAFDDPDRNTFNYHSQEHGFLIAIASIIPDTSYYGGLDRMFTRGLSTTNSDRFDWFTPELANLGQEPVPVQEAYLPLDPTLYPSGSERRQLAEAVVENWNDIRLFPIGFQNRYNDYRFKRDVLFGQMADWTFHTENQCYNLFRYLQDEMLANLEEYEQQSFFEFFTSLSFRTCDPLTRSLFDRVFAVSNPLYDHFNFEADLRYKATRSIPMYVMPDLNDGAVQKKGAIAPNGGSRL